MKTQKNIFIAFVLNLFFSVFEFVGGILTGSIAIAADAVHDFGDAASIGISYVLEKKSKKQPDGIYTYGYARYSLLGGAITTLILLIGSCAVLYKAAHRFLAPVALDYDGTLILACVGLAVNLLAAYFTHGGGSINQRAVNLHMLEDVFGWVVILIGAVVMRFTGFYLLDPILSVLVAVFILINAARNLKEILDIFLIKKPKHIETETLKKHLLEIDGVVGVHHIHFWTTDGEAVYATLHIVAEEYSAEIKGKVKEELREHGVSHVTVEMEREDEACLEKECILIDTPKKHGHCHCHSHH
ncbi:MAG: cation transporter [Clostridia bacterium]|nr:cation transporter [Clostridia bacterium]